MLSLQNTTPLQKEQIKSEEKWLRLNGQGVQVGFMWIKPCIQSHHVKLIVESFILQLSDQHIRFVFSAFDIYNRLSAQSIIIISKGMKKQSVQDIYKRVTQVEHVLLRPDTYIGSIQMVEENQWVINQSTHRFEQKKIKYIPGLFKIFDEILVNAADNFQKDQKMSKIQVKIDEKSGRISVLNDGKSIPVQIHRQHKIYVAELIFGHLLTSSNYQDKKKKVTGGRNGYGAKLANIFSKYFAIETADSSARKLLKIQWKKNMSEMSDPEIIAYQGKDYTKVTFIPDFSKFQLKQLTPDIISLFKKRVYDLAGILKCSVYLNGEFINVKNFQDYAQLYFIEAENQEIIFDSVADSKRWQVLVTKSQGQFQQISFVNGIATTSGGTHVSYICDQIVDGIMPHLTKKSKDIVIKPFQIKAHLKIFINCLIQNPSFTSQTKQNLTTPVSKFGSTYEVSDKIIKGLLKIGLADKVLSQLRNKQNTKIDKQLKKIKNSAYKLIIPKLEDANMAGRSTGCTLILTEGDSAKALAMSGIETLGRDYYGVYPLRGKLLNVNGMTFKQVMDHFQLSNLVKILGLTFGKKYTSAKQLRYDSVMIMADQDIDGSHIKGLVLNFFHTFWPSLCEIEGFLKEFVTPIIRCRRGNEKIDFFSKEDYQVWKIDSSTDWKIKYYKGLGTSTSSQAREYFSNLVKHQITFLYSSQSDKEYFDLVFAKANSDKRKNWLQNFDQNENVDYNEKMLKIEDFFNKQFRHFSISDNIRSIPSIVDGMKPSQRKVLFSCFKRNLRNQIKVAQLAGYVAEHSAYHHGEASLCSTIVSMAQNYVGSNNLNLLQPIGQFGTRHLSGKDSASPRYIFTQLNSLTRYLFPQTDDHVVEYQEQQNMTIQPKYYYPILPLVLINGSEGIGTGWSTNIQPHKVSDVILAIKERIKGQSKFINVGWQGFRGQVKIEKQGVFSVHGVWSIDGDNLTISQIPINRSIRDYKAFLEEKLRSVQNVDPELEDIREYHQGDKIQFVLTFVDGKQPDDHEMSKYLKLQSKIQQSNMIMFDATRRIKKYETVADIIQEYYYERMEAYSKRKKYLISKFAREVEILQAKIKFVNAVMMGKYKMMNTKDSWVRQLVIDKYKKYNDLTRIQSTKITENLEQTDTNKEFNYLLNMPIWSFCQQKVVELQLCLEEAKKAVKHFREIKEEDMWLKDLQDFERAWQNYQNGLEIKAKAQKSKLASKGAERRKRLLQMEEEMIEKEVNKKGKPKKGNGKNIMEQSLENDKEFLKFYEGRKKVKGEDWYKYEAAPSQNKDDERISSLLSKYLPESGNSSNAGLSFAERIKNRMQKKQQINHSQQFNQEMQPSLDNRQNGSQDPESYRVSYQTFNDRNFTNKESIQEEQILQNKPQMNVSLQFADKIDQIVNGKDEDNFEREKPAQAQKDKKEEKDEDILLEHFSWLQ